MAALKNYEELLDTNPLLRLVIPFIAGIGFTNLFYEAFSDWENVFFAVAVLAIVFCGCLYGWHVEFKKKYLPFFAALSIAMFSLGGGLLIKDVQQLEVAWPDSEVNLRVLLVDTPKEGEKMWQATAKVQGGIYDGRLLRLALMKSSAKQVSQDTIRALERQTERLRAGDLILLRTRVQTPKNLGHPDEFDYANWLKRQGFSGTAFCNDKQWGFSAITPSSLPLSVKALCWRDRLVQEYETYFKGRDLAVLSAMTLGDKTRLDTATRYLFSQTGVSHILALSGLHLSILFMLFNRLVISRFRHSRFFPIVNLFGIAGLWFFALLAGFPLSLLRAVIMFTVMQTMVCLHRDSFSLNNMGLAAMILLLISPQSLFDVGFQLSFVSVASILLLSGIITCPKWMEHSKLTRGLFDTVWVSCCAQLGTAPLVAYYFHTFPIYNLLANIVAIPLAYAILATAVVFFAFPFFQSIGAILLGVLLATMEQLLSELSQMPGAVLELYPSWFGLVMSYCFIVFFIGFWLCRKTLRLYLSALSLLLLALTEFYHHRPGRLQPQILFYNINKVPVVHAISSSEHSYLWSTHFAKADSALRTVKRTFWKEENIAPPQLLDSALSSNEIFYTSGIIGFRGYRIGICCDCLELQHFKVPFSVDYLLLARGSKADLKDLLKCYQPKVIVLDASLTDFYYKKYSQEVQSTSYEWYDVRKQGALIIHL